MCIYLKLVTLMIITMKFRISEINCIVLECPLLANGYTVSNKLTVLMFNVTIDNYHTNINH